MTDLEIPPHSSYSQVNTYKRCGEQFRLERLLHAPQAPAWALLGGSAVHEASEEWDHSVLKGTVLDNFTELWSDHFHRQIDEAEEKSGLKSKEFRASGRASKEFPNKEDYDWWMRKGPEFVANWAAWRLNSPLEIWTTDEGVPAIEIQFTVMVAGEPVRGAIDRIMVTPDGQVLPVDLKSGAEPDDTLQLGTYAKAMRDLMGVDPDWGTYWMARTGSTTSMHPMKKFTDEYLDYFYGSARKGMKAGIFLPNVTRMCSGCSVRKHCFAWGGENAAEFTPLSSS